MATEPLTLGDVLSDRNGAMSSAMSIAIVEHRDGLALFPGHINLTEATARLDRTRLDRTAGGHEIDRTALRHVWAVFDRHEQVCEADLDQNEVCFCWERSNTGWYWREVTAGTPSAIPLTVVDLRRTRPAPRDPHETAPADTAPANTVLARGGAR